MKTSLKIGLGIGGGVVALGAAVGVGALAAGYAESNPQAQPGQAQTGSGEDRGGWSNSRGPNTTEMASALAEKLGVDEAKMTSALEEVMGAERASGGPTGAPPSGAPSGRPSDTPREGRAGGGESLKTMAASLAEKLDLDEAKVLTALEEVWKEQGRGPGPSGEPTR